MIQLIQSNDGRLILASNQPFPADIQRVEYFRDLRLMMLSFEEEKGDSLMPCEIDSDVAKIIEASPNIIIAMKEEGVEPYGYQVSLIQIGV